MSSEPTSEDQFAEQFVGNPHCRVCGTAMYAYTEDGICSQSCCDKVTPPVKPEPTYTMSQAIDRIIDGLRLEWVEHEQGHWVAITQFCTYMANEGGLSWWRVGTGDVKPCDSIEHGKQLCLADYRTRFRAEIEKAVKS
ncbi:hypothetical protein UFOVP1229_32 [uncultured Caudovirales phage]|uniref:Uncharacterized protein n=1 Tax=uncultured Caudovirales phage TaxID=2100421 RepID=A0A6J5R6P0_9CAUD|nr:hypothetical protein UFOVP1229_32 [uncultured Caudovirales phage]